MMGNLQIIVVYTTLALLILTTVRVESRLRCYNCTYVEYKNKEKWGGLEECQGEEFDEDKIPVIRCDGKCVTRSVWGDVVVTQRTCHRSDEGRCSRIDRYNIGQDGYLSQVCCGSSRCNHSGNDDASHLKCSLTSLIATETMTLLWFVIPIRTCFR
ncbi:uncharacterized protein LOC119732652 [Patiria miniata]|uniref:Protein quiver n=1 Tax=Patiria miniata TaxID=46514 RepID=A0A914AE92_PATMI|nr:uncharacterized protein LOC119732652 [Patiria miniata]